VTGGGRIATSILIQPDGKIVVGGNTIGSGASNNSDFDLVRYNPDGTFDESFGSGGKVSTDFSGIEDTILALALQPNGRIVAAGVAFRFALTADFALARYKPNGKLDESFGSEGKVTTNFNLDNEEALAVAIHLTEKSLRPDERMWLAQASILPLLVTIQMALSIPHSAPVER
jgi:uncharacterized delta-60 repeat protein